LLKQQSAVLGGYARIAACSEQLDALSERSLNNEHFLSDYQRAM
jgi:hypothetical protein